VDESKRIKVKVVRCRNAKERMVPLKKMCWEKGVMVEYVAPYSVQQNGKVQRQFPTDLRRAIAMLDSVQLSPSIKMMLIKEAIRYADTMANISIKDNTSHYEKFFGVPSALKPEHCVNFGRIAYITHGNKLKKKYKPRATWLYMQKIIVHIQYLNIHQEHRVKFY
jgi:hypothetical protein